MSDKCPICKLPTVNGVCPVSGKVGYQLMAMESVAEATSVHYKPGVLIDAWGCHVRAEERERGAKLADEEANICKMEGYVIEQAVKLAGWRGLCEGRDGAVRTTDGKAVEHEGELMIWPDDLPAYFSTWEGTGRLIEKMQARWKELAPLYPFADEDDPIIAECNRLEDWFTTQPLFELSPETVQKAALKIIEQESQTPERGEM